VPLIRFALDGHREKQMRLPVQKHKQGTHPYFKCFQGINHRVHPPPKDLATAATFCEPMPGHGVRYLVSIS
jgi:hypothetical protein